MAESFLVRIAKEEFIFSAAHFITFNGHMCEPLHGHNYRVAAEVHGPLDENHYVVDFLAVRDMLKSLAAELDHHVLLPTQHQQISVREHDGEVTASFEQRRWVFPRDNCVLLPVANTTAELLARFIGQRLRQSLRDELSMRPVSLRIEVDECAGQLGVWSWSADTEN